jgi:hypothetical protein
MIWEEYRKINKNGGKKFSDFEFVERFAFYAMRTTIQEIQLSGAGCLIPEKYLQKQCYTNLIWEIPYNKRFSK